MKAKINIKRYFQVLGISLAVLLIGLLGALGFGFWDTGEEGLLPEEIATVDISGGKINILLMGVDEGGLRTDCVMVGSYDTVSKTAKLLSIPRDTRMRIGAKYQKINAAHAINSASGGIMGAQGTVEAVTRLTGIPINYYIELPFDAVAECMDLLGPVTFEIPDLYNDGVGMVYDDPVQDLHINLKPGLQELNGEQVVHLLRYRKGNLKNGVRHGYTQGDIERIEMQQRFFRELVDQKLNSTLILKLPAIFKQLSGSIKTNLTVKDVIKYSKYLTDFDADNLKTFSLPGTSQTIDGGSYWICNIEETRTLIQTEFGYSAQNITTERTPGEKPSSTNNNPTSKPKSTAKTNKATVQPDSVTAKPDKATANPKKTEKATVSQKTEKPYEPEIATPAPTKKPESTKAPEKESISSEPSETKTPTKE